MKVLFTAAAGLATGLWPYLALQAAAGLAPAPTPTAADVYSNWTCPRGSCVTTLASNGEYVADLFGIANSDCTAIIGMRAECSDGQGTQLLLGDGPISLNNSSSLISASGAAGCFNALAVWTFGVYNSQGQVHPFITGVTAINNTGPANLTGGGGHTINGSQVYSVVCAPGGFIVGIAGLSEQSYLPMQYYCGAANLPVAPKASGKQNRLHVAATQQRHLRRRHCRKIMRDLPESSWLIPADKLEISTRKDGRPWHLGSGGFGDVYRGLWDGLYPVAVKQFRGSSHSEAQASIVSELAILKGCRHRHIIQFLGVAIKDSEVLLVTEVGSPFWQVCTSC
eukprot:jgi/Astpho2/6249/fgenesh1_pg.00088_%23_58_t